MISLLFLKFGNQLGFYFSVGQTVSKPNQSHPRERLATLLPAATSVLKALKVVMVLKGFVPELPNSNRLRE